MPLDTRAAISRKDSLREFSVEELTGTEMQTRRWRKREAEEIGRHVSPAGVERSSTIVEKIQWWYGFVLNGIRNGIVRD